MHIHQLSVSHDERQDRLLLRLNTQDAQEFRFWLTRRLAIRLLPAIDQSLVRLEAAQPGVAAVDTGTQQILTDIKRDAFLQTADFATPFVPQAQQLPLGPEPMLVTDAQLSLQPNGSLQVVFQQKTGDVIQSCHLNLQSPLVHGLIHLVKQTMAKADWGLAEIAKAEGSEAESPGGTETPAYKH
jgi:hypothetical protein